MTSVKSLKVNKKNSISSAVLVIKKVRDSTVLSPFIQLVEWLIEEKHMVVWVESAVLDDPLLMEDKKFLAVKDKLVTFKWVSAVTFPHLVVIY